jgi:hypothetical protein
MLMDMPERGAAETRAAYMRRCVMTLYAEHRADGMLPTSNRFLVYELIQREIINKHPTGILKPALCSLG